MHLSHFHFCNYSFIISRKEVLDSEVSIMSSFLILLSRFISITILVRDLCLNLGIFPIEVRLYEISSLYFSTPAHILG